MSEIRSLLESSSNKGSSDQLQVPGIQNQQLAPGIRVGKQLLSGGIHGKQTAPKREMFRKVGSRHHGHV